MRSGEPPRDTGCGVLRERHPARDHRRGDILHRIRSSTLVTGRPGGRGRRADRARRDEMSRSEWRSRSGVGSAGLASMFFSSSGGCGRCGKRQLHRRFPSPVGRRGFIAAFHRTSASIARLSHWCGVVEAGKLRRRGIPLVMAEQAAAGARQQLDVARA